MGTGCEETMPETEKSKSSNKSVLFREEVIITKSPDELPERGKNA